jgi:outer membrane protein OmpA-like peptidoglycan-associated protein
VLGLTMAELMLLLLFCLLLVSAAALQRKDQKLAELGQAKSAPADLTKQIAQLKQENQTLRELVPAKVIASGGQPPADMWRELVLAKNYADALQKAGVSKDALTSADLVEATAALSRQVAADPAAAAKLASTLDTLKDMTPAEIATMAQDYRALKGGGLANASPSELVSALGSNAGPDASGHNWPPIITLSDDGFSFAVNSADLTPQFKQRLQTEVTNQVADLVKRYNVDVVEVVGHTDEQPIRSSRNSTLDVQAISAMAGQTPIADLVPFDNAGLGMARAIAVANALEATNKLGGIKILPLSGAQMIMPGDRLADGTETGDARDRRRIEIRVRRSAPAAR